MFAELTDDELLGMGQQLIDMLKKFTEERDLNPVDMAFLICSVAASMMHTLRHHSVVTTLHDRKGGSA